MERIIHPTRKIMSRVMTIISIFTFIFNFQYIFIFIFIFTFTFTFTFIFIYLSIILLSFLFSFFVHFHLQMVAGLHRTDWGICYENHSYDTTCPEYGALMYGGGGTMYLELGKAWMVSTKCISPPKQPQFLPLPGVRAV